jgi:hypothetical protein
MNVLKSTRAALIAFTLAGATVVGIAPANAQPRPDVDFSIRFGDDRGGISFGTGNHRGRGNDYDRCYSDRQVRGILRDNGYREIRFFDRRGRIVNVTAEKGRRDYAIGVDSCSGKIVSRDRLRRR